MIRHHIAINYIMSTACCRLRPYRALPGGCKRHAITKMLKKTNLALGAKKDAIQDNMIQQYLYHEGVN